MKRDDRVDWRVFKDTAVDHLRGAVEGLLGGLEEEFHRPRKFLPVLLQNLCRGEKDGGMSVVAAGMHNAFVLRRVRRAGRFLDREGVDVRPKTYRRRLPRSRPFRGPADDSEDARLDGERDHFDSRRLQLTFDKRGGCMFIEPDLRVPMHKMPCIDHVLPYFVDFFPDSLLHFSTS